MWLALIAIVCATGRAALVDLVRERNQLRSSLDQLQAETSELTEQLARVSSHLGSLNDQIQTHTVALRQEAQFLKRQLSQIEKAISTPPTSQSDGSLSNSRKPLNASPGGYSYSRIALQHYDASLVMGQNSTKGVYTFVDGRNAPQTYVVYGNLAVSGFLQANCTYCEIRYNPTWISLKQQLETLRLALIEPTYVYVGFVAHTLKKVDTFIGNSTLVAGTGRMTPVADGPALTSVLYNPNQMAQDPQGGLVMGCGAHSIRRLYNGTLTTLAGSTNMRSGFNDGYGTNATFFAPWGLAVFNNGTSNTTFQGPIFVADTGNHRIRRLTFKASNDTWKVVTLVGQSASGSTDGVGTDAMLYGPTGLALDSARGLLYIADYGNYAIRVLTLHTNKLTTLCSTTNTSGAWRDGHCNSAGMLTPQSVALDGMGGLFFTEFAANRVRHLDLETLTLSTVAGSTSDEAGLVDAVGTIARFFNPNGITYDPAGNIYVTELLNRALRVISWPSRQVITVRVYNAPPLDVLWVPEAGHYSASVTTSSRGSA